MSFKSTLNTLATFMDTFSIYIHKLDWHEHRKWRLKTATHCTLSAHWWVVGCFFSHSVTGFTKIWWAKEDFFRFLSLMNGAWPSCFTVHPKRSIFISYTKVSWHVKTFIGISIFTFTACTIFNFELVVSISSF